MRRRAVLPPRRQRAARRLPPTRYATPWRGEGARGGRGGMLRHLLRHAEPASARVRGAFELQGVSTAHHVRRPGDVHDARALRAHGGFPDLPLMEDYAFSLSLRAAGVRPRKTRRRLITSARRFGPSAKSRLGTMYHMARLRRMYREGTPIGRSPARTRTCASSARGDPFRLDVPTNAATA